MATPEPTVTDWIAAGRSLAMSLAADDLPGSAATVSELANRLEAATVIPQLPSKPEPSADQYVITTIYTRPEKEPIRHVYGPYASRSQAARERDRMMVQSEPEADSVLTMFVSKLLS